MRETSPDSHSSSSREAASDSPASASNAGSPVSMPWRSVARAAAHEPRTSARSARSRQARRRQPRRPRIRQVRAGCPVSCRHLTVENAAAPCEAAIAVPRQGLPETAGRIPRGTERPQRIRALPVWELEVSPSSHWKAMHAGSARHCGSACVFRPASPGCGLSPPARQRPGSRAAAPPAYPQGQKTRPSRSDLLFPFLFLFRFPRWVRIPVIRRRKICG